MKKVLCIGKKGANFQHLFPCKIGRTYNVIGEDNESYLIRFKESGNSFWVLRHNFIDMKMVWSAVVFFFILLFAMTGESIVDFILKTLFGL
jgi:hypothetical protein